MKDFFLLRSGESLLEIKQNQNSYRLVADHGNTNIMVSHIKADSTVWITPGEQHHYLEYYMLLSGEMLVPHGGKQEHLFPGDSFYFVNLDEDVSLTPVTDIELLCVSSQPVFGDFMVFVNDLNDLCKQTEEKDHYTYGHCTRVMRYAQALSQKFALCDERQHDLLLAALYHDVGKCYIPREILNKPGRLTDAEFASIRQHPADSAKILDGRFSKAVTRIARGHHERLDGSGYPDHLKADQIDLETRILAVADVFDAMTTDRPYKAGKELDEAIREFEGLTHQYDADVIAALRQLGSEGVLGEIQRLSREGKLTGGVP